MVKGIAGIIAHAAIHRNIGAHIGNALDRPHLIEGDPRRANDRTPGSITTKGS
jgi:hypothetical protein